MEESYFFKSTMTSLPIHHTYTHRKTYKRNAHRRTITKTETGTRTDQQAQNRQIDNHSKWSEWTDRQTDSKTQTHTVTKADN